MLVSCAEFVSDNPNQKSQYCLDTIISDAANRLIIKSYDKKTIRLDATLTLKNNNCFRVNDNAITHINIDVQSPYNQIAQHSHNAHIPIKYYIELSLVPNNTISNAPKTSKETSKTIHILTLENTHTLENNIAILKATAQKTITVPMEHYDLTQSKIIIGFVADSDYTTIE
ncbi:MAG: hypothetical protein ACJARD_000034 [Alphaproteobacteria bacterium]|jgi:hypothetical protein